jgi:parallel beta-helix repeat protein
MALQFGLFTAFANGAGKTTFTFDDPLVLSPTAAPGAWFRDRYVPARFQIASFNGDNRLQLGISAADGAQLRPPVGSNSYASQFYNLQGRKYDLPPSAFSIESKLYIPAAWINDTSTRVRTEIWTTGRTSTNTTSVYPYIGFANVDGISPTLRFSNFVQWVNVPTSTIPLTPDTWYTVGMELSGGTLIYRINNIVVGTVAAPTTVRWADVFLQAYNFNDNTLPPNQQSAADYDAYWDDLEFSYREVLNLTQSTSHPSLQAAINAANPGDELEASPGIYNEDIVINKPLSLKGSGPSTTTILGTKGDASTKTVTITSNDVELAGFTITRDGNNTTDWNGALNNEGISPNTGLSGLSIHNNYVTGNRNGILLYGTVNSTVRNNIISNNRTGLHLVNDTSGLVVEENEITGNWTAGVLFREELTPSGATGSVFTNNNISGNWYAQIEDRHSGAPGSKPKNFAGNWLGTTTPATTTDGGGEPGYAGQIPVAFGGTATAPGGKPEIAGISSANVISAPYLTVGTDTDVETTPGRGTYGFQGNFSQQGPIRIEEIPNSGYATIQQAINAASPGQTVVLSPGSHSEPAVNVNKAVTIKGPNANIAGTASRSAEARIVNTPITITAAGAVLDGVEIYQTNSTMDAILVQAAATVENSIIRRDGALTGQSVRGITTATALTGVTISGNLFTGDPSGGFFGGHKSWASGIYSNGGSATISGNTFENCRSALNLDDFNAGISLTGNTFRSSGTYLSFGGVTPTDGNFTIAGNDFDINLASPTLPSTLFNNSLVAPTFRIDATGNTFGGVATTALTNANKFAIEARMFHRGRSGRNGVVDYVAGQQIEVSGTTIASAINAASAGNTVLVGPGVFSEDVALNKSVIFQGSGAGVTTISGPIGGDGATVRISAANAVLDGFTITRAGNNATDWNNSGLNSAGIAIQSQGIPGIVISNNEITGNRSAIDINNSNGHTVRNNVIAHNHTGLIFRNQTDGMTVVENVISSNRTVGILFLDASSGTNSPVQSATSGTFSNNSISGNWYGQIVDRQVGGSLPAPGTNIKNFEGNWLGAPVPVATTANSAEPGYAALIPVAFGGTASAPGGQPDIAGPASANLDYKPYLSVGTDTDVETTPGRGTYGFQGNPSSLWDGTTNSIVINGEETSPDYFIPTGTTVTITNSGSLNADELELAPGGELVVQGGDLTLGEDSKISGNFTIFNSFGSWNINGDTTFEIGQSLALISDIHVAAGKTLTVNGGGELILDGCVIDSQTPGSPYNIEVETNGLLTIARSVVSDAVIDIDTSSASVAANLKSKVYDSSFTSSDIEATADAKVYHNLFDVATEAASNTDATTAFDSIDGWDNVTDAANLQNKFTLEFAAPTNPTRTLDSDGNLFVRPSDPVIVNMNVAALNSNTIVNAEALLGFNSSLITLNTPAAAVTPSAGWDVVVEGSSNAGALGLVDSTLGLELTGPGDDGISTDSTIATVDFTAAAPGLTVGFFRVQTDRVFEPSGRLLKDTRLTKSDAGVPSDLTAFTANTGELVIDNLAPAITPGTGTQVQPSVASPVNVFDPLNRVFRNGTDVIVTFTGTDNGFGLAGLDAADVDNDLVMIQNGTPVPASFYTVTTSETGGVVTYTVSFDIPTNTPTGTYAISATVQDRSGNVSAATPLGSFIIGNEALATVELEGFVGTTRDVTFVATGGITKTWTKPVTFTSSVGTVVLDDVPAGTTAISAKTAWTLRSKVSASFTTEGVGSAVLTGADKLRAGDITGDNVINTFDYSVLRFNWLTPNTVSDIDGSGATSLSDYNLLKPNFYTIGEAQ